jgi:hypothetical protein
MPTRYALPHIGAIGVAGLVLMLSSLPALAQTRQSKPGDPLYQTVATLDRTVFDAFNTCDLNKFAEFFADDVEFYHDVGGVSWTRESMIAQTRAGVCGKIRRELIPGTIKVRPIKSYGALETGQHRFCQVKTGQCDGISDFLLIWRQQADHWEVGRVISYGHGDTKP